LGVACSRASPTFAKEVAPILAKCGGAEICHGGFGVTAWPYKQLVNVPQERDSCGQTHPLLVVPGSLDGSYLMHKLTGVGMCPESRQMPLGGALPAAEIQVVADWICQGALNN
jgi:hypothetical protein